MMKRIIFIVAMWKRRSVERITFGHLRRAIDSVGNDGALVSVIAVGSEGGQSRSMAEQHGFDYIEYPNNPLGKKWNAVWQEAVKRDPDVIVSIGSDSLISRKSIVEYIKFSDSGFDFMGYEGCLMLDYRKKKSISFDGYLGGRSGESAGVGRAYSRSLFSRIRRSPFLNTANKGLDSSFMKSLVKDMPNVRKHIIKPKSKFQPIEIKSEVNIWGVEDFDLRKPNITQIGYMDCLSRIDDDETISMVVEAFSELD